MTVLALSTLVWALGVVGALGTAVWRSRRAGAVARRVNDAEPNGAPPLLLIRPCAGDEPGLEDRIVSVIGARSTRALRVRIAVASPDDPARGPGESAAARLRSAGLDAAVVVTAARGPNQKVAQLAAAMRETPAPIVVWADSDVDLTGTDLDALVAPLGSGRVGAVWAPPVERGPIETVGDRASQAILGGSLHAFVVLRHLDPELLVGKLVAARAEALAAARFESMTDVLGEDVELARRLRAAGLEVEVAPFVAVATPRGRSLAAVLARQARWIGMVRAQRPARLAGYPLLLAATPLIVLAALVAAPGSPALAACAIAVAIAGRLLVAACAARWAGRPASAWARLVDVASSDFVLLAAFGRALASRSLSWRGRMLRLSAGRLLEGRSP